MIEALETPITNRFMELVSQSNDNILLCSPFIKKDVVDQLLSAKPFDTQVDVITASNTLNYKRGSSDISAIKTLVDQGFDVRNYNNLHAKIYVFDDKKALVTSSNLTNGGFSRNFEYGLLISEDKVLVQKIRHDFYVIFRDKNVGKYTKENLSELEKIIPTLAQPVSCSPADPAEDEIAHIDDYEDMVKELPEWKRDVFGCLNKMKKDTFTLQDVYRASVPFLKKKWPNNHTVEASIRRNLEEIRNLGMIRFTDNQGTYKKLWK